MKKLLKYLLLTSTIVFATRIYSVSTYAEFKEHVAAWPLSEGDKKMALARALYYVLEPSPGFPSLCFLVLLKVPLCKKERLCQETDLKKLLRHCLTLVKDDVVNPFALYAVNYLREGRGLPLLAALDGREREFMKIEEYLLWKEMKNRRWASFPLNLQAHLVEEMLTYLKEVELLCLVVEERNLSFNEQVDHEALTVTVRQFPDNFSHHLSLLELTSCADESGQAAEQMPIFSVKRLVQYIMFDYNLLREIHGKSLEENIADINIDWAKKVYPSRGGLLWELASYKHIPYLILNFVASSLIAHYFGPNAPTTLLLLIGSIGILYIPFFIINRAAEKEPQFFSRLGINLSGEPIRPFTIEPREYL